MKKIKLLSLLLIFSLQACDEKEQKEYYKNGELKKVFSLKNGEYHGSYKEYYLNGNLKIRRTYNKGKEKDSSIYYYKNPKNRIKYIKLPIGNNYKIRNFTIEGKLKSEGFTDNKNLRFGKWKYYSKDEKLNMVEEYFNIDGKQYLNQQWHFNRRGDTIYQGVHSNIIFSKDTIKLNEPMRAVAYLNVPLFKGKNSKIFLCLPSDNSINLDKTFSNINQVKLDTFYNLNIDKMNKKWFSNIDYNKSVVFGKWFTKTGKKNIRGILVEYYENNKDSLKREEFKIYFDKTIYVKDGNGSD